MTDAHTPNRHGPWHVHTSGKFIVTAGPTNQADTVATLHAPQGTNNARLIAAAPEMYDCLALCYDTLRRVANGHLNKEEDIVLIEGAYEEIEKVSAKARGQL